MVAGHKIGPIHVQILGTVPKMNLKTVIRENAIAYAVLLVLFSFVITYQVRSSLDTVHFAGMPGRS